MVRSFNIVHVILGVEAHEIEAVVSEFEAHVVVNFGLEAHAI